MHHRSNLHKHWYVLVASLFVGLLAVITPTVLLAQVGPAFTSTAPDTAVVGVEYSYQLTATGDLPMTFTFTDTTHTPPAGMNMDGGGEITWTPTDLQTGAHTVEVQATNASGFDVQEFTVTVYEAPSFTSSAPSSVILGSLYSYQLTADGDPTITFAFTDTTYTPPNGMGMNGSGEITWTPISGQGGSHTVEVQAVSPYGVDTQQFTVLVNVPPAFTSSAPTAANVGAEYSYQLAADGDPTITFAFTDTTYTPPSGMGMDGSGLITWTPDSGQIGSHTVEVQALNTFGVDTQQFTVDVSQGPAITTTAVIVANVDELYQYDVDATGVPTPTFSLITNPSGMTIDPDSGLISWTPTNGQIGSNSVQVRATNVAGTDDQSFNIDVRLVPQVTSVPNDTTITAGQSFDDSATASGDPAPTFSLVNNTPDWLTIHPTNGQITGNSTQANAGVNVVTVQAANAAGADTDSFTITVDSTAMCVYDPLSYLPLDGISNYTAPDMIWSNNATCTNHSRCPTRVSAPSGNALYFDGNDDALNVTNLTGMQWEANDSFTIQAWVNTTQACAGDDNKVIAGTFSNISDGIWWLGCGNTSDEAVFYLREAGASGQVTSLHGTTAINDGQWHLITAVRDATLDQNRIYVDGVLEGIANVNYTNSLASSTSMYIGYYGFGHARDFYFDGAIDELVIYNRVLTEEEMARHIYHTENGVGYCSETAVTPQITSTPGTQAVVNNEYTYDVEAVGIPEATYSLVAPPTGMTIDPSTGLITWTPTSGQDGQQAVEVLASNSGGSDSQTFNIQVDLHLAPSITSTPVTEVVVGNQYTYDVEALGEPVPQFSLVGQYPDDMTINANSGLIEWDVPSSYPAGPVTITVQATNLVDTDTQTFDIHVRKYEIYLPTILK